MIKKIILLSFIIAGFAKVYSCDCNQFPFKTEIDSADLIFQGTPIDKKITKSEIKYKFIVDKIWKGKQSDTLEITTGIGKQQHEMEFNIGRTYIVYSKHLHTECCRRNNPIDSTYDDFKLDFLFLPEFENAFKNGQKNLTNVESAFLEQLLKSMDQEYDFSGKSILFTSNLIHVSKSEWFQHNFNYEKPSVQILELTEQEKLNTGYDAILVTWSKRIVNDKMKTSILKQLE